MKAQKWITLSAVCMIFSCFAAQPSNQSGNQQKPMNQPQQPTPQTQTTPAGDCNGLSGDEQMFANRLTMDNRAQFCSKFNGVQRASAMKMAGNPDADGNLMSPDQAVQKISSDNKLMQDGGKGKGACPVK